MVCVAGAGKGEQDLFWQLRGVRPADRRTDGAGPDPVPEREMSRNGDLAPSAGRPQSGPGPFYPSRKRRDMERRHLHAGSHAAGNVPECRGAGDAAAFIKCSQKLLALGIDDC